MPAAKQKILIVDDDANIAELIALYLTKECYDTMTVGDGEAALEAVGTYKPDLMILDLMLPGMDGYQVCQTVRKTSQLPIIMLSAKGEVFDKVLGLKMGADDYMEKPFESARGQGEGEAGGLPGSLHQSHQLFGAVSGKAAGDAAEGAGASVFPGVQSQPCLHAGAAPGSDMGL